VLCGVSYGGTVAARVAARAPERTLALVLASTPAPGWHLRPRHRLYARLPWLFGPLFLIETPWRLRREIAVAIPDRRARFAFKRKALATALRTGLSFSQMAARALLLHQLNLAEACARISAPTLVVTGEAALDHVVPTSQSSDWVRLIARATPAVLAETGHIGTMTRPREFAALVADFVAREVGQATSSGDSHHAA
jgi:pimeloyl-ACP methyl ester carboxylesterase